MSNRQLSQAEIDDLVARLLAEQVQDEKARAEAKESSTINAKSNS